MPLSNGSQSAALCLSPRPSLITLEIDGRTVTIDDSFLDLSYQEKEALVDEIAAILPAKPSGICQVATRVIGAFAMRLFGGRR